MLHLPAALIEDSSAFIEWKQRFGKSYLTVEAEGAAQQQFLRLDALIRDHNAKRSSSFTVGHNEWSDSRVAFGLRPSIGHNSTAPPLSTGKLASALSDSVDWVAKGAVGPVQNQGCTPPPLPLHRHSSLLCPGASPESPPKPTHARPMPVGYPLHVVASAVHPSQVSVVHAGPLALSSRSRALFLSIKAFAPPPRKTIYATWSIKVHPCRLLR